MKGIRLIIFDLDGTLIDAYPAIIRSVNYTLKKLGLPPQDNLTIRRAVGWGDENLLRPFVKQRDLKRAILIYRKHHHLSLVKDSRLLSGVKRLLTQLKNKGYKLAVASNRPTKFSHLLIRHLKISCYFDFVLCADRLKNIKPHPEILKKIMQKLKVKPKETLYVGDMTIDVEAGRGARVRVIAVTTGSSSKAELLKQRPYRTIRKISALLRFL
ncbi:MAG: HAD family hydrolase [Candidatus Omnitrophica bacterium]|nr:HAD family hydrolase [Candidatus Omnitrophota bacterium]